MGRRKARRGEGQRPLFAGASRPFTGASVQIIAAWADRRIDISEPQYLKEAPEAVKAIHDRYYATAPGSYDELRWRLQLIAEEEVGHRMRSAKASEDTAAARLSGALNGAG